MAVGKSNILVMAVGKSNSQSVALYTTGQKIGSCAPKIRFTSPLKKIKQHERTNLQEPQPNEKSLSLIRMQARPLRCRF